MIQNPWQQPSIIRHSQRLLNSYQYWLGKPLLAVKGTPEEIAQTLFEAPFVVVSHGTADNPIFNYANRQALKQWEMNWDEFTQTPSRASVEPGERDQERQGLLAKVNTQGYVEGYQGIRVLKTGKRFKIADVTIWNVLDELQEFCGQAATYQQWIPLD